MVSEEASTTATRSTPAASECIARTFPLRCLVALFRFEDPILLHQFGLTNYQGGR